jgi:protein phosphatase
VETIDGYMAAPSQVFTTDDVTNVVDRQSVAARHLRESIFLANQKIYKQSLLDKACRGMGTTVSVLYLAGDSIITANVGDSPIYLLRNGEIEDLFTPHTLLHERKKIPKSREGRFSNGKLAHVLTRAVGIRSEVNMDHVQIPYFKGDIIVICSDGLSGKIKRNEIQEFVLKNDSETACQKLTRLANDRGGEDNITVIVVKIKSERKKTISRQLGRASSIPAWIGSLVGFKSSQ